METSEEKKFDLRTHIIDPKTGKVVKHQPYRCVIDRERGTHFIRDGKKYHPDGSLHPDQDFHQEVKVKNDKKAS